MRHARKVERGDPPPLTGVSAQAMPRGGCLALWLTRLVARVCEWRERAEQRTHLAQLDDRMLKDIGLSAADARREAEKPFWRD